jgi:sialic acid synthase SpsE
VYQHELTLPDKFDLYRGYSSHTHGIEDALLAIARGAKVIEKHMTLSKVEETVKDNAFAISPEELAELSRIGRGLEKLA